MGLTARHLESHGLPTVIIGSALDIIEHCGVPRFLFTDLPLGNPLGHPGSASEQRLIVDLALSLFTTATTPNRTLHAPVTWAETDDWRARYAEIRPEDRDRLKAAGEARRRMRAALRQDHKQTK